MAKNPQKAGIGSRIAGFFTGAILGVITGPVGWFARSCDHYRDKYGNIQKSVVFANVCLIPAYIIVGPFYGAYRGVQYGFNNGLQGPLHHSLDRPPNESQIREACFRDARERRLNAASGNNLRTTVNLDELPFQYRQPPTNSAHMQAAVGSRRVSDNKLAPVNRGASSMTHPPQAAAQATVAQSITFNGRKRSR
jgi:hypothetical protein